MASITHQFLAMCIVRKMREKCYKVVAFEGDYSKISETPFRIPPRVVRHRPDVLGVSLTETRLCIGEAKTPKDLLSHRTKEQFVDYADIILEESSLRCELIIAVPKSAEDILTELLEKLSIGGMKNVSYLAIPEVLFPDEKEIRI